MVYRFIIVNRWVNCWRSTAELPRGRLAGVQRRHGLHLVSIEEWCPVVLVSFLFHFCFISVSFSLLRNESGTTPQQVHRRDFLSFLYLFSSVNIRFHIFSHLFYLFGESQDSQISQDSCTPGFRDLLQCATKDWPCWTWHQRSWWLDQRQTTCRSVSIAKNSRPKIWGDMSMEQRVESNVHWSMWKCANSVESCALDVLGCLCQTLSNFVKLCQAVKGAKDGRWDAKTSNSLVIKQRS